MSRIAVLPPPHISATQRMRSHVAMMRLDHSVKQLFIVPGIVVAAVLTHEHIGRELVFNIVLGFLAMTAVASSNYVLNELLDAPFDRLHPTKCQRPVALGFVSYPIGYVQWLLLGALGLYTANHGTKGVLFSALGLWVMGLLYNIPPVRSKDIAYLDVISEAINNPIRFCAGWYMVTATLPPPMSLLISYWMLGSYFMALKRFSEYRQIGPEQAGWYRKSFRHYSERSLLNSVVFYAATAMLFFGAFIMRYRLEWVLAFPVIALLMAEYFNLSFEPDSSAQNPEKLFRERRLMVLLVVCVALLGALLVIDVPAVTQLFPRTGSR